MSFEAIGLTAKLCLAVADEGYTEPTPVQRQSIPAILALRDIMVGAQTGTGKTAGFTLPMLQLLNLRNQNKDKKIIRSLILVPTRELAAQVGESVRTYGKYLPLQSTTVFGGVSMGEQIKKLQKGVDILIATPGRLLDHVEKKTVNLSHVQFLVLDEADRMLDMGFIRDIKKILKLIPGQRQNLLFSATFSGEIKQLAEKLLNNPEMISIAKRNMAAENINHTIHPVDHSRKRELLIQLIQTHDWPQVLVFTNMKYTAGRLADRIQKAGIRATAIHGDKSQSQRTRALEEFKKGKVDVLVATDVAARGLDIEQLPFVVNYELPVESEIYVHRVGRTGRAGYSGEAISLVAPDEMDLLKDIEDLLKHAIPRKVIPGFEPDPRIQVLHKTGKRLPNRSANMVESIITHDERPVEHWSKRVNGIKAGA